MQRKMKTQSVSVFVLAILLASMLSVMPYSAVAAAPTITLSPAAGTYVTAITITGTGFPSGQEDIAIWIKIATKTVSVDGATLITLFSQSIWVSGVTDPGKVRADANGFFKAQFYPPTIVGGAYNVFAEYAPVGEAPLLTAAVPFTVKSYLDVRLAAGAAGPAVTPKTTSGFYGQYVRVRAQGFGDREVVRLSGLPLALAEGTSDASGTVTDFYTTLGNATGGAKTVTATGEDSGLTATATFTIKPVIAIYGAIDATAVTISSRGAAPVGVFIEGHGFGYEEEIAGSSIKIGGVSTIHAKITADRKGTFGFGAGNYISLIATTDLPLGRANVTIKDVTFGFEAGNLMPPTALAAARKGVLLVSNPSTTGGIGLAMLDKDKYQVGGRVWVFGVNLIGVSPPTVTYTYDTASISPTGVTTPDTNGAIACYFALPTSKFGTHTLTVAQSGLTIPLVDLSVIPELKIYTDTITDGAVGYAHFGTSLWLSGTGFNGTETLYLTVAGSRLAQTIAPDAYGTFSATSITVGVPDLPQGTASVIASGTTEGNTAEGFSSGYYAAYGTKVYGIKVLPRPMSSSLTLTSGRAGTMITLQTRTSDGIHGLKPSTKYDVVWGADSAVVTSFTSTAKGGVPVGVQFRAPSAVTGQHIIDIRESGTTVSAIWGNSLSAYWYGVDSYEFQYIVFTISVAFTATPSVGFVNTSVTISGAGLAPNAAHYVRFEGVIYATFTSTATGAVPEGVKFTFPETASTDELGTSKPISVEDATGVEVGTATFILQASATLDKTTAKIGETVTLSATGLVYGQVYNVIFDWALTETAYTGTIVFSFTPNALGTGSGAFTVPSDATPGKTVTIMLLRPGDTTQRRLTIPPKLTVEAVAPPVLPGTGTFTPSAPKLLDSAGREVPSIPKTTAFYVQITLKNNVASDLSVYVIVQIKDAKGTVVTIGLTAADIKALATKNVPVAFIGISTPGTYSATIYVWSSITEPVALAPPTTFTFTVV